MSATLRLISPCRGGPWIGVNALPVVLMRVSARELIVVSFPVAILYTPRALSESSASIVASNESRTALDQDVLRGHGPIKSARLKPKLPNACQSRDNWEMNSFSVKVLISGIILKSGSSLIMVDPSK